jgi:hypothetical protein
MTKAGAISLMGHDANVEFESGFGGSRKQSSIIPRLVDWDFGSSLVNRVDAKYWAANQPNVPGLVWPVSFFMSSIGPGEFSRWIATL